MMGFWIAPSRANATNNTSASSVVGSCHDTTVPSPTPRLASAAATFSASSRNVARVNVRP